MSKPAFCPQIQKRCSRNDGKRQIEPTSAWIKLGAVFLANIIISVPEGSIGIFYDYFLEKYEASNSAVGWVVSVYMVSGSLLGLVMSPLVSIYGCRPVAIFSACVFALGMCLVPFAPSLPWLIVFYGILGGIGFGGYVMVTFTLVQQCFFDNRGLATGIAILGATGGTVIGPVLIEYFLSEYSLSGALILHGALYVQAIAFSLLMKSPRIMLRKLQLSDYQNDLDARITKVDIDADVHTNIKFSENGTRNSHLEEYMSLSSEKKLDLSAEETPSDCKSIHGRPETSSVLSEQDQLTLEEGTTSQIKKNIRFIFEEMINFSLLKELPFVLCTLFLAFVACARVVLFSQIVNAGINRGIPAKDSAYFLTIMGLSNLVFRDASAIIMNFKGLNPLWYTSGGAVCLAASGFVAAFAQSYPMFVCSMIFMGAFEGFSNTILPMVIVHVIGVRRFPQGFAIVRVLTMPLIMAATPLSGWFVDVTGEYTVAFLVVGGISCSAFVAILLVDVLLKKNKKVVM